MFQNIHHRTNSPSCSRINNANLSESLTPMEIDTGNLYNPNDIDNSSWDRLKNFIYCHYDFLYEKFFHIYFIIIFEILFYFNYIVDIEKIEIKRVLANFAGYINALGLEWNAIIPNAEKQRIHLLCEGIKNDLVSKDNVELENKAYNILWSLGIVWITLTIIHFIVYKSFKKIGINILKSIFFIALIGLFEYFFFTNIVVHYATITNEEATCDLFEDIIS
jgi:hypothetical protein